MRRTFNGLRAHMTTNSEFSSFFEVIEQYALKHRFEVTRTEATPSTTTGLVHIVSGVIKPTSTKHVQFVVEQANQYHVALHPLSCGKNWGYSDATPSANYAVTVDLSAMNKIIAIDQKHNFAVIEPGVTQQQLSDALQGTDLFMDCTGSSTGSSVVGNIVERGFGHTAFGDRFSHSCSYEVVLGNGRLIGTGHLAFDDLNQHNAHACHTPRTTGPSIEGLFSQSNFGIVTKLCIWLLPKPEKTLPYVVVFESHQDFLNAIEPLAQLKAKGITTSTMHIGNKMRLLSSSISWQGLKGLVPQDTIEAQLKQLAIGEWVMSGALYGTKAMVEIFKKELSDSLNTHCNVKIKFLEPALIKRVSRVVSLFPKRSLLSLKTQLDTAQGLINMHMGIPTDLFLRGCYHRHDEGYPAEMNAATDVAKDGCGLIWLAPTAPTDKESIARLLDMLTSTFEAQGFHLYATLSFISSRSVAIICNPVFDAKDNEQVVDAQRCTNEALTQCIKNGYPPYRVANVQWQSYYSLLSSEHQELLKAIKAQLDPNNVISPGRYGIGA